MSKKDYELIARVLRRAVDSPNYADRVGGQRLARDFADALAEANPRFARETFLGACGVAR